MDQNRLKILLHKYQEGTLTAPEATELNNWFHALNLADTDLETWISQMGGKEKLTDDLFIDFKERLGQTRKKAKILYLRRMVAVAASIVLFLSAGLYFLLPKQQVKLTAQNQKQDIRPGSDKAILSANGRQFVLDSVNNGVIINRGNLAINKNANGQIAYAAKTPSSLERAGNEAAIYDTLTIPRGGQYQLKLADGSRVWLNSATQIRYPERFAGNERKIELISGEAYFEVKHNDAMPFKVIVKGQTIEDLGTHFNINAYDDEPAIKTTLLEGSIRIAKGSQTAILKPGQQSIIQSINNSIIIKDADTEEAIAWKNGYFKFDNENIQSIMRKVARWYDVDIQYQGNMPNEELGGKMSRYKNVSEVLEMLELTKSVHFKVEGRRIIVMQ